MGTYGTSGKVTPTICVYYYGDGAAERATGSEQRRRAWFIENFAPVSASVIPSQENPR